MRCCQVSKKGEPLLSVACNSDGTEILVQKQDRIDAFYVIRGTVHVALKGHEVRRYRPTLYRPTRCPVLSSRTGVPGGPGRGGVPEPGGGRGRGRL